MSIQHTNLRDRKAVKEKAKLLEPIVRVGKNGLTESLVEEIKLQLKKRGLIKVKMLRSFLGRSDKRRMANEIAERTDSMLVDNVGFVVVLAKKNLSSGMTKA